jgi:XTP/dITP diphosphohydrolase
MAERRRIVVATQNQGKLRELTALLGELPFEFVSVNTVLAGPFSIDETETTFHGNAALKAAALARATGLWALADDSGLEVDALDGAPGVRSARYAGDQASDADNVDKLLTALRDTPSAERRARFRCVLALARPDTSEIHYSEGVVEGHITDAPRGSGGFGYDPIFMAEASPEVTFAELSADAKNALSHRRQAVGRLSPILLELARSQSDE